VTYIRNILIQPFGSHSYNPMGCVMHQRSAPPSTSIYKTAGIVLTAPGIEQRDLAFRHGGIQLLSGAFSGTFGLFRKRDTYYLLPQKAL
jgi:hypothetical protein